MAFNWQDPQYGITLKGAQAVDANGVSIGAPTTLTSVVKNPDGSILYTWQDGTTLTSKPGGQGAVTSSGLTNTFGPDGTTSTTRADGSAATQAEIDAANAQQGFGGIKSWGEAAKTGFRSAKEASEKLNIVGTPGLNQDVANDKLFGGANSNKSLFTDSAVGKVLGGAASVYGLGGLKGDGTQPGSTTTTGGAGGAGSPEAAKALADFQKSLAAGAAGSGSSNPPPAVTAATYTGPSVSAPPSISAGSVTPTTVTPTTISAGSVNAPQIGAPGTITPGSVTAGQVSVGDITKPGDITAQHIDRIMMDPTQTSESRDAMLKALAMAEGAANGTAPSAAVQLLQKAIDTNARQQLGAAGALQGRSPGAALRAGTMGLMAANASSAADMAALRATEQATGRQQYGTFASSLYQNDVSKAAAQLGADVDIAKTNANNLLEAAKSNQSTALNTSIANMNKQVQVATANMQAALDAGKFNVATAMQAQIENIKNTISVATSNASMELQSRITNLSAQMDAAKANQATALAAGQTNAVTALNAQIAKMQADLEASKANLTAVTQANIANATLAQNAGQFNAHEQNTAAIANTDAALRQQIIDNAKAQGLRDDQIKILLAQMGFGYQDKALAQTKDLADQAAFASGIGTLAKLLASKSSSGTTSGSGTTIGANGSPILD